MPLNWKSHFNFYNLNPTELKDEQLEKRPILLIHGNCHNQTAWLSLASGLEESDLGPVFTVDLPSGSVTEKDYEIVNEKIAAIQALYNKHVKIDVVGHSRGGYIGYTLKSQHHPEDIGKVIRLGSISNEKKHEDLYEITGEFDVLVTAKSVLDKEHQMEVDTGHLGLMYSPEAHKQIIQWLKI